MTFLIVAGVALAGLGVAAIYVEWKWPGKIKAAVSKLFNREERK